MNRSRLMLIALVVDAYAHLSSLPAAAALPVNPALLALALIVIALEVRSRRLQLSWPPILMLASAALVLMVPATLAGLDQLNSWLVLEGLIKDLFFLGIVYQLASASGAPRLIACSVTLAMVALSGLAVVNQFLLGNAWSFGGLDVLSTGTGVGVRTVRHQGPFGDPNFFGRVLTLAVPLALALAARAWNRRLKPEFIMWLLGGLSILGGVYLTGSRGTMAATVAGVVVWMLLAGPRYRRRLVFLPLVILPLLLVPGVGSRLFTLDHLAGSSSFVEGDGSVLERGAAARVTFAIFEANPLLGVGPGNANTLMEPYVAAGDGLIYRDVAAHDTYLQLGAEDGVIGLLGWLAFFLLVLVVGVKTVRAYPAVPHAPPEDARLFAAAGTAAMASWMIASVFLHLAFLRPLFMIVALIGVLYYQAPGGAPRPLREGARRSVSRRAVTVAVALLVVAGLGVAARPLVRPKAWMAEVPVSLQVGRNADAYRISLTNRRDIVATYAAVARDVGARYIDGRASLTVIPAGQTSGSALRPSFIVRVVSRSRTEAERLARNATARGSEYVARSAGLSAFALTTPGQVSVGSTRTWVTSPGGGR